MSPISTSRRSSPFGSVGPRHVLGDRPSLSAAANAARGRILESALAAGLCRREWSSPGRPRPNHGPRVPRESRSFVAGAVSSASLTPPDTGQFFDHRAQSCGQLGPGIEALMTGTHTSARPKGIGLVAPRACGRTTRLLVSSAATRGLRIALDGAKARRIASLLCLRETGATCSRLDKPDVQHQRRLRRTAPSAAAVVVDTNRLGFRLRGDGDRVSPSTAGRAHTRLRPCLCCATSSPRQLAQGRGRYYILLWPRAYALRDGFPLERTQSGSLVWSDGALGAQFGGDSSGHVIFRESLYRTASHRARVLPSCSPGSRCRTRSEMSLASVRAMLRRRAAVSADSAPSRRRSERRSDLGRPPPPVRPSCTEPS